MNRFPNVLDNPALIDRDTWPGARVRLKLAAARKGGAARVAAIASDPSLDLCARSAAACALLDAQLLDPIHGADVFEALVFGLLTAGQHEEAGLAAVGFAAIAPDPGAIARADEWRALCGVPREAFWGDAAPDLPEHEVLFRAWATPPDGLGGWRICAQVSLDRVGRGRRTLIAIAIGPDGIALEAAAWLEDAARVPALREQFLLGAGVEAPVEEVASLVQDALLSTPEPAYVPGARWLAQRAGSVPAEPCEPLPPAAEALALIQSPETLATWWLDDVDLDRHDRDDMSDAMLDVAGQPSLAERFVAATDQLARWRRWRGELRAAGQLAALARDAERDWRKSTLLWALIVNSRSRTPLPRAFAPGVPADLRYGRVRIEEHARWGQRAEEGFRASPEGRERVARGTQAAWPRLAAMYSIGALHATPLAWTPLLLERLLFDLIPSQATTLGEDAGPILGDLDAFCAYMGRVWGLPQAAALCGYLRAPDLEARFAEALDDETCWSDHKRTLIRARRAGVKTADAEAFLRWMQQDPEMSRRMASGPTAEA